MVGHFCCCCSRRSCGCLEVGDVLKNLFKALFAWIADGLSLDETRVSLLMWAYGFSWAISGVYLLRWHADIPEHLYGLMCLLTVYLAVHTEVSNVSSGGLLDKALTAVKGKIGI